MLGSLGLSNHNCERKRRPGGCSVSLDGLLFLAMTCSSSARCFSRPIIQIGANAEVIYTQPPPGDGIIRFGASAAPLLSRSCDFDATPRRDLIDDRDHAVVPGAQALAESRRHGPNRCRRDAALL